MTLDGEPLELEKGRHRTYTATVYKNGSVETSVVNLNGMPATVFEHVNVCLLYTSIRVDGLGIGNTIQSPLVRQLCNRVQGS